MPDTLRSLRAELQLECRGDFAGTPDEDTIVNAAINDAIESIWMKMMQANLARFIGRDSPVTFQLAINQQQVQLVGIPDPTVAPAVVQVAGGALADAAQFWVGYSYATESGSESNLSPLVQTAARNPNNVFQVTPPAQPGAAFAKGAAPTSAFGYNVYAGRAKNTLALQNTQPYPFSIAYTEPVTEWQDYSIGQQEPPIANQTADNLSYITHMDVLLPDMTYQAWNQADIDSQIMRRMSHMLASASPFEVYIWEMHNDGTLEFRPVPGTAYSPRYWYIAKPRRLRYDPAVIPYQNITGVHKFLKCAAKADLYLGANEFMNSQGWEQKADAEALQIQNSLLQETWRKNSYVTPYLL